MKLEDLNNKIKNKDKIQSILKKDIAYQIGRVVEEIRTQEGMTQAELANRINSKQEVIARIESGVKIPSIHFLDRIAHAFDTYLLPPKFKSREKTKIETKIQVVGWDLVMGSTPMSIQGKAVSISNTPIAYEK
jgi:ribosome-binding protein aMBF1 (putative translation factor)